jgi:hypothetical protein
MKQLKRSQCSILPLVLKGKWYDMIASGEKREEYRADKPYWRRRFSNWVKNLPFSGHLVIAFSRGYRKPDLLIEVSGINIFPDRLHPDWGEPTGLHYVIALNRRVQLNDNP